MPASSSPSVVALPMSDATAVDPEEAFVASLSSCHMLWFLSVALKRRRVVEAYADSAVGLMEKNSEGRMMMTRVTLRPAVSWAEGHAPGEKELHRLHHLAHAQCFIANSVSAQWMNRHRPVHPDQRIRRHLFPGNTRHRQCANHHWRSIAPEPVSRV